MTPLPIMLESCSTTETDLPVFYSALEKIILVGGCRFFVSDVISEVVFGSFWLMFPGLQLQRNTFAQPLGRSVSLKFSLETRLESESFEPLIDFLAFLVQTL